MTSSLQFHYPWVLYLVWLAPAGAALWHLLITRRAGGGSGIVSPRMAAKLAPRPSPVRAAWQMALFMTALLLAIVAAARPQWGSREETVFQKGRDLMIVLDVSRSMLATDVHPSRLGRARIDLLDLIRQFRGDRAGLVAFRGRPLLLCPLTTDYGFLTQILEGVGVDSAPAGETSIGDAIDEALRSFDAGDSAHKAIVMISDGEDLAGRALEAADRAREKGVAIFTVGLGSSEGSRIPSPANTKEFLRYQGTEVKSRLDNATLQAIAEKTGGAYVPVGVANVKLGDVYRDRLSRVAARDIEESVQRRLVERYQVFLFPAVCLLLAAAFLSRGQVRLGPVRSARQAAGTTAPAAPVPPTPPARDLTPPPLAPRNIAVLLIAAAMAAGLARAQGTNTPAAPAATPEAAVADLPSGRDAARAAQRLHLLGKYSEAATAYRAAGRNATRAARDNYEFNAGCALLSAGRYDAAADAFRGLTDSDELQAPAAYNLGCALYRAATAEPTNAAAATAPETLDDSVSNLKQAAAAFQKALRLDPGRKDSVRNLAVVARTADKAIDRAKLARLMARYGQMPPGAVADMILLGQRALNAAMPAAFTNETPALIGALEKLAADQENNADLMIPLKSRLMEAMSQASSQSKTNAQAIQQQAGQLNAFAESIRDRMGDVADALRDLDVAAAPKAAAVEPAIYTLWKGLAAYAQLLREDMLRQTNAITATVACEKAPTDDNRKAIRDQQDEAADLTALFSERFEQAVPAEGIKAQTPPSTNAPAAAAGPANPQPGAASTNEYVLSPADRAKILDLAKQAEAEQKGASATAATDLAASLAGQRRAYDLLVEIEKLLPKDKQPQPQQEQKQEQKQEPQPQPQPEQKKEEPKPQEKKDKDQMSPEDVKRMLEKARQREKDHETDMRERNSYAPLTPIERDW